jgi:hypothetical protein
MWKGSERRSPVSVAARAAVAAQYERVQAEREMKELPRWRFRRRAELERAVERAKGNEHRLVTALGGKTAQD